MASYPLALSWRRHKLVASFVLPCVDLAARDRSWWDVFFAVATVILKFVVAIHHRALTEAFTLIGRPVDEDFGGDDIAKREEHLHELAVAELLGQVVDEQVAALGS